MSTMQQKWDAILPVASIAPGGVGRGGLTPTVAIRRKSDSLYLQAGGGSWGAGYATNSMTEVDAVNAPGFYEYAIPPARFSKDAEGYYIIVEELSINYLLHYYIEAESETESTVPTAVDAVKDRAIRLPVVDPAETTGLVLGDFTIVGVLEGSVLSDPVAGLSLSLDEVDDVDAPGYYELNVIPTAVGLLYLRLTRGTDVFEFYLQVQHEGLDLIGEQIYGAEGDVTLTVENELGDPVEGAIVRIFSAAGTKLIARATTDAAGEVSFGLPVGTYQVRFYKAGVDFANDNPTFIVVEPNAEVSPILEVIVPSSASIGDRIALLGRFFGTEDVEVLFGTTPAVAVDAVDTAGTLAVVDVPVGLTDTVIPVRVQKPDPNNLPSGKLISNSVNLQRT